MSASTPSDGIVTGESMKAHFRQAIAGERQAILSPFDRQMYRSMRARGRRGIEIIGNPATARGVKPEGASMPSNRLAGMANLEAGGIIRR